MAFKRRLRFDKRIRFRKSMSIMYILLFVVLASLGVGYSYIKSNLNINGTANVTAANWDVHFENLIMREGSVEATSPAAIDGESIVAFGVDLSEPNDFYEFTVDVVNDGTMDAMLNDYDITPTLTTEQAKYLEYKVTYFDNLELTSKDKLKAGEKETLRVRVSYIENSDKTNYPTEDQALSLEFNANYIQASNSATPVRNYVYRTNNNAVSLGVSASSLGTTYTTPEELISATGYNIFLRHVIKNNVVTRSDVGIFFSTTNKYYYLIGGGATYDGMTESFNNDSIYFDINKNIMNGTGTSCRTYSTAYICTSGSLQLDTRMDGSVMIQNSQRRCVVSGIGDMAECGVPLS